MPAPFGDSREVAAEGTGTVSCSGRRNGSDELVGIYCSAAMVTAPPDRAASTTQLVRSRSKWIDSRRMVLSIARPFLLLELRLDGLLLELRLDGGDPSYRAQALSNGMFPHGPFQRIDGRQFFCDGNVKRYWASKV